MARPSVQSARAVSPDEDVLTLTHFGGRIKLRLKLVLVPCSFQRDQKAPKMGVRIPYLVVVLNNHLGYQSDFSARGQITHHSKLAAFNIQLQQVDRPIDIFGESGRGNAYFSPLLRETRRIGAHPQAARSVRSNVEFLNSSVVCK